MEDNIKISQSSQNDQAQLRASQSAPSTESETGALAAAPCSARLDSIDIAIMRAEEFENTILTRNLHQKALASVLVSLALGFSSPSKSFEHLEHRSKTLDFLDKKSGHRLKPLLNQWQKASRPDITWHEILNWLS